MSDDLRYPIGKYDLTTEVDERGCRQAIYDITQLPALLRQAIGNLSAEQLATPYRPGGWTVRQVTHHVADSHLNAYTRCKLALTEDAPVIKPYDEAGWAELPDTAITPVETSVVLLEALHARWSVLLSALDAQQLERKFNHPDNGLMSIKQVIPLYAWHGKHHVAHITALRQRMNWN